MFETDKIFPVIILCINEPIKILKFVTFLNTTPSLNVWKTNLQQNVTLNYASARSAPFSEDASSPLEDARDALSSRRSRALARCIAGEFGQ